MVLFSTVVAQVENITKIPKYVCYKQTSGLDEQGVASFVRGIGKENPVHLERRTLKEILERCC